MRGNFLEFGDLLASVRTPIELVIRVAERIATHNVGELANIPSINDRKDVRCTWKEYDFYAFRPCTSTSYSVSPVTGKGVHVLESSS